MGTLFSYTVARFWRAVEKRKKIILGIVLFGFILGATPLQVVPVKAQPASYQGPTGYDSANAIEKGVDATVAKYEGPFKDTVNSIFEAVGRFLANIFLLFARLLLKLASFMIDFIMVIAGYNGYLDSTAVNIGWTVVRDITNMLFIIILLVIAFATILGLEGYEWKQLLPKLVTAAILVNFSRTICGLLIDASQIVMITFLNAVSATIGGNIINAFRLPTFEAFHPNVQSVQLTSSGILSAAALAMAFSGIVTAVLGAYIFILLGRLIRLWVLIVLSPLAFVMGILPSTSGMAHSWWSELMDNLVTGPVIMFFIWLSLIVVGTGQANQELIKGSRLADKSPIEQAFGAQEQAVTPTDIGGWNNLANFAIAIGMLFAGAKVASSIGGSSGNLLQAGLDFGKKVALAGVGYGLIRRFAGGAASTAGGVVGGIAKSPFTLAKWAGKKAFGKFVEPPLGRMKKELGARWEARSLAKQAASDKIAADTDKKRLELAQSGQLGTFQSLGMRAKGWWHSSNDRLNKNVENWESIVAEKKKQAAEAYGVSSLEAGTRLARERIRTERVEQEGARSKELKEAERKQEFSQGVSFISDKLSKHERALAEAKEHMSHLKGSTDEKAVAAATERLALAQKAVDENRASVQKELQQKYKGNSKVDPTYLMDYYDQGKNMLSKAAQAEHLNHIMHNNDALAAARQKDALLIEEGKPPVHEQHELARQEKEYRDLFSSAGFDRSMANVGTLRDSIKKNQEEIAHVASQLRKETDESAIAALKSKMHHLAEKDTELVTDMARLMSSNAARGADYTNAATATALAGMGPLPEVKAGDVVGQQARELSAILQRKVFATPEAVDEAMNNLKQKLGKHFDAFMESYVESLNSAATGGAVNKAGLFRGVYDNRSNSMAYHAVRLGDETGIHKGDTEWSSGKREYALANSRPDRITSFSNSVDHIRGDDGTIKMMAATRDAVERIAETFGAVTQNQVARIDKQAINDLRSIFQNMAPSQNTVLLQALASKNTDSAGLAALLRRVGEDQVQGSLPSGVKDMIEAVDGIKRALKESNKTLAGVLDGIEARTASAAASAATAASAAADTVRRSRPSSS